jgi:hypothetical protein
MAEPQISIHQTREGTRRNEAWAEGIARGMPFPAMARTRILRLNRRPAHGQVAKWNRYIPEIIEVILPNRGFQKHSEPRQLVDFFRKSC